MKTHVLVVEDEGVIAEDIRRTLKRLGYVVPTVAATGLDAVAAARTHQPKVILMDIKLRGDMDGIQAAQIISTELHIPVVFLTSHSDEGTLARVKETEPYGYLLKPFEDRELRTAIEVALLRHALEVRLTEREHWFSTTLECIGDAVVATDPNMVVTFMNSIAEKVTGWPRDHAAGRPLQDILNLVDAAGQPVDNPVNQALLHKKNIQLPVDIELVQRHGEKIPVDDSAAPILDSAGRLLGSVMVFRDITDRRALERRVAISGRMAALGTLAAGVGHEISNPLTYLYSNLEYALHTVEQAAKRLQKDPAAAPQIAEELINLVEPLAEAKDGADRVRTIVTDLQRFSRTDREPFSSLHLGQALERALRLTAGRMKHRPEIIRKDNPCPLVWGREGSLVQVISNLLVNAADAVAHNHVAPRITLVTGTTTLGHGFLEIQDNGCGIPVAILPQIFDPFFTTKEVGHGTGLGLSVSHAAVAAMNGHIEVESREGEGSLFRVILPAAPSP